MSPHEEVPLTDAAPADKHRRIAAVFSERTVGVRDWDAPAPVAGWTARDVVEHLVTWFPAFLHAGTGIARPAGPAAADDPVGAWRTHGAAIQDLLDDPASTDVVFSHEHTGTMPLPVAVDRFYTSDVFMHTWDLARASDLDHGLDRAECAAILAGMEPMDEVLRASGQYGPRMPVDDGADAVTRLMAFVGREPGWTPA